MPTGFKSALDGQEITISNESLRKRFAADVGSYGESTYYNRVPYGTIRQPSTRGLFGSVIDDRELLFAVQREPAAFRIVFGVAKDALDNWFSIQLVKGKDDGSTNDAVQKELDRLQAKWKFVKLLTLKRLFGYSLLLLGYDDSAVSLEDEMTDVNARIAYIEPYSKLEINRFIDIDDPNDIRDGYPEFYLMKKSAGVSGGQVRVHYTRGLLCSNLIVDHRYLGWSELQCLYDDVTGYRYMRYGLYQTMIRYGSGFPDVTLKGPEANQEAIDKFIASGQFDNLNGMKYFVHNETQKLEFKGFVSATLNPMNYYQIALDTLSMGSGIPEPMLKGAQSGAVVGAEINERAYFKILSAEQTSFEAILRPLLDKILLYLELSSKEDPLAYKIIWKASYEPTQKEKAELDFLNAQTAKKELLLKTVDEVRKDRYNLLPLKNHAGEEVIGLRQPAPITQPEFNPDGTPMTPEQIATKHQTPPQLAPFIKAVQSTSNTKPGAQASPPVLKGEGNPAVQGHADAVEPPPATPSEKAASEKKK
jgi:hypothetical protein